MSIKRSKRLLAFLIALVMTLTGFVTAMPLEAAASDWDTENITDIYILAETTRSVTVSFHLSHNITHTDPGRLAVGLYLHDNHQYALIYDFDISSRAIDNGTTVGDYYHTFKGLEQNQLFDVVIWGLEPDWQETTSQATVKTPSESNPVISLNMGWRTGTSVWLKGDITSTGTGPGPYRYLAEEVKSNALVIVPKAQEPAGNLSVNDPNAVVVFNALWSEPINVFDHYAQYLGLDPNKEYVAQAMLTNIYDNTGYSEKVYFRTFAFPQITIEPVTSRSYDAYIYADITLDTGDSLSSLGLYADDGDTQQPKDDPERVAGSLVRIDDETGIATFHLTGLTPETDYDVQVFTRSGAGEKWSGKSTFTTLPQPERAVVETGDATSVRNTKAMMNATITDMKYSYVLEQGFVYSETEHNPIRSFGDPAITEVLAPITSQTAPSAIAGLADGLKPNTTYYYQSFVHNNEGTSYGGVKTFTTPNDPQVDTLSGTTDKTPSSITLYGEVLSTGGLTPTLRGVVYTRLPITPALGSSGSQFALNAVTDDSTGQFSADLTGLSAGTLYTYRAFIHNQYGTVYGDELTFTTDSSPNVLPVVTTDSVPEPAVGETYADVSGSFTAPEGTTVSETGFVYSEFSDPVLGDADTYFIPLTDTDGAFETTLTGLSSQTTYYVRAYAVNENGVGYGGNVSFTTTGSLSIFPPAVVSSLTADPVTANTAAVTMTTTGAVALGRDIFYSSTNKLPAEGGDDVLSVSYAFTDGPTKVITGLAPNTTYYLRGRATAAGGTKYYGGVLTITTDAYGLPVVTNDTPPNGNISFDSAQVYAQVAANGMPVTKAAVVWSDSVENPTLGAPGVMSRQTDEYIDGEAGISYQLSTLKSGTTYYYTLYAYNAGGWSSAPVQSFTTETALEPVAAVTGVASGATTAAVTARLTQDGEGNHAAYGLGLLVSEDPAATFLTPDKLVYWYPGAVGDTFTANFTGLEPSTQYYARPYVSSVYDETFLGDSYAFTTQSTPLATVELYDPMSVTASSADFTVSVLSGGGYPVTERGLVYNTAGAPDLGDDVVVCTDAGTDPGQSAAQLTGLTEGTKYHVRAFATTENGTAYSDELFFTARDSAYTVAFDPNGGNVSPTSAQTGEDGKLASLPVPTRTDYTFNGWFTQASGGDPVTTYSIYIGDTTVYAHWAASGTYSKPTVVTVSADGVGDREVTLTGEVTAPGSSPVLECGFAISPVLTLPLYNGADSVWTEGCPGSFSLAVSELTPETTYYFRAYAISDEDEPVSYGEVMQFTTLEDTTVYGVFTSPVTDLTTTGAALHGSYTLTTLYLSELSSRGFVYGPSQDPRLGGENVTPVFDVEDETSMENGMMADITGLEPGTAYHVCAFVTISGEITWYSEDRVFTTPTDGETPEPEYGVATNAATGVTTTGATLHGSADADEPLLVVQRGFVYGTAADPALGHEGVFSADAGGGAGSFSADVTGLSPGTAYHVRAYASFSNQEILYGEDRTFTTRQDTGGSTPWETSDDAEDEIPPAGEIGYLDMPETNNPWGNVILYTDAEGGQFIVGLGIVEGTRMKYISRGPVQYEIIYNAKAFDDIAGHWAEHDIDFNSARLLFLGVAPTLFAPDTAMTRGMFATVIGRMYGADPAEYTSVPFDDVPQNEFYAPYIQWAAENEIVFGVSADKFEPERPVTRQEMAAIMHRFMTFLGLDLESGGAAFDDEAQIAGWARDDVDSMRGTDILNGKPNNLFDPCADSTRAEVAAVFHRLIEYIVNSAS